MSEKRNSMKVLDEYQRTRNDLGNAYTGVNPVEKPSRQYISSMVLDDYEKLAEIIIKSELKESRKLQNAEMAKVPERKKKRKRPLMSVHDSMSINQSSANRGSSKKGSIKVPKYNSKKQLPN